MPTIGAGVGKTTATEMGEGQSLFEMPHVSEIYFHVLQ